MKRPYVNKQKIRAILAILLITICSSWAGFLYGFYEATGVWPIFHNHEPALVPSDLVPLPTSEVQNIVAELQDKEYGEGYNCLDFAWDAMRKLQWKGQPVGIVRLDLEPDPDHSILIVGTKDQGWQYLEPQTGQIVKPVVGGKWAYLQTIVGIYVMQVTWTPIDKYIMEMSK